MTGNHVLYPVISGLALLLATSCASPSQVGATKDVPGVAQLTVDAQAVVGDLKPLYGVNGAPDMTFIRSPQGLDPVAGPGGEPVNVIQSYRDAHVNLVRTHDSGGVSDLDPNAGPLAPLKDPFGPPRNFAGTFDLNVIFPNLNADPNDPASYNFGPTDKLIAGIAETGAQTMFRIGRSGMNTALPPDPKRYARIVSRVVQHYNKGWANGFQNRVLYWEVWNEPDLGRIFWSGTPDQYYQLYESIALAVKAADPSALVGGPAIAMVNAATPYREGFLAYVRDHKLPLDFFSWHWYAEAGDPYDFVRLGKQMRSMLDRYGFKQTISIIDEWNYALMARNISPITRAAFVASSRIYMQDAAIDLDAFYRADREFPHEKPTKVGQALLALGRMKETPRRLRATGGDTLGLALLAGKSANDDTIQILLSDVEIPSENRGPRAGPDVMHAEGLFDMILLPRRPVSYTPRDHYTLSVANLKRGQPYEMKRFRLDAQSDMSLVEQRCVIGPNVHIGAPLANPSVDLVVLTLGGCANSNIR